MVTIAVELATAYVSIVPSARGFGKALDKEMGGAGSSAGSAASASFGEKFTGGMASIGKTAAKGLGASMVVAGGVAVAAYKIGESFDDAYDKIRVGTGTTGSALEALEADFKAVATSVPASFDEASTAVTDLNQRLGIAGKPLQDLSGQFLELSRITETDVAANIDALTRVFGDWQIGAEAMPGAMDKMFRAAQNSGVGIDALGQTVVQFGAPLRNLGFGFDESIAMLAQFNKAGVNTETVFAGMKAGVGKMAKAGEPIPETFRRVVDEITKMGPGADATAKAIELFGQRAGPDLADAISGGKFEIGGMLDAISGGSDTIMQAGDDTADFAEKLTELKNKVLIRLEPIANRVFGAVADAVETAGPYVKEIAGGFSAMFAAFTDGGNEITSSGLAGTMEEIGVKIRDLFDKIAPKVKEIIDALKDVDWAGLIGKAADAVTPVVDAFVDLATAVADFAVKHWPKVEAVLPVILDAAGLFGKAFAAAVKFLADKMDILGPALIAVATGLAAIKAAEVAAEKWTALKDGVTGAADKVKHLNSNFDAFLAKSKSVGSALKSAGTKAVDFGKSMVTSAVGIAKSTAAFVANKAALIGQKIAQAASTVATVAATAATAAFNFVMALNPVVLVVIAIVALVAAVVLAYQKVDWFRAFIDKAFNVIKDVITKAIEIAWKVITTVFNAIKTVITTYVNGYLFVIRTAFNAIKGAVEFAINLVWTVITTVFEGIKTTISTVIDAIKAVATTGFDLLKGIITAPIEGAKKVVETVFDGIRDLFSGLPDKLKDALGKLGETVAKPFEKMGDLIKKAWNATIGGFGFEIPDIPGIPGGGKRIEIPEMHRGGPVGGRSGQEVLRILEAGEWVLSRDQVNRMRTGSASAPVPGMAGAGSPMIGNLAVTTVADATADEVVDAINAKLGWVHTTRRDR